MKLSIIVPVYKVENTLCDCVNSILNQSFEDYELILVDDGSPDKCPIICDELASSDSRIKVIHKKNGGLSDARNAGIEISHGEYLMFVDSDDTISPNTIEPLVDIMEGEEEDMLEFSIRGLLCLEDRFSYSPTEYWHSTKAYLHTYACNKIFRRKVFDGVRFPKGKVFEDVHTLPKLLRNTKKVGTTDKGEYIYNMNPNGITSTAGANERRQLLEAHINIIRDNYFPLDSAYYMHVVDIQIALCELTDEQPILSINHVSLKGLTNKHKIKAIITNIFGLSFLCHLLYLYRRICPR